MAALRASDDFVLTEEMVRDLLPRKSALPPGRRYAPSRSLLLRLYAGTHGAGCALQKVLKGTTPPSVREAKLVELWQKLTADYGSDPEELYVEARLVHRKRMEMGGRTPSLQLRLWLEGPPAALPTHSSPTHGSASRSPSPTRRVRPLSPFASNSTGGLRALRIEKVDGGTPLRLRQRISDYSPAVQTPGVGEYDTTRADMGRVDLRPSASFRSTEPRGGGIEPNGDHGPQRGWNVCFYNGLPSVPRARESSHTQRGGGHTGPPFNSTELRHSGIEPLLDGPRRGVGEIFPTFAEEKRGSVKQQEESQQHSPIPKAAPARLLLRQRFDQQQATRFRTNIPPQGSEHP
ncbi:hypothetical protein AB1Y20_007346 [Prymnesium parvum]|uniref:Uncharacterized protein n=1 Tax=Prymnesium parvum TaxID=97485 RepID=A0AB34IWU0_PRYPA